MKRLTAISEMKFSIKKQPSIDDFIKRCSPNIQQIYRRTPMSKFDFNIEHGCSSVNILHIFRTPFSKNTSGGLPRSISTGWVNQFKLWFLFNSYWLLSLCCRPEQSHRDDSFSTSAKFWKNLYFLSPDMHTYVCVSGE